jgi:hypothetical protein
MSSSPEAVVDRLAPEAPPSASRGAKLFMARAIAFMFPPSHLARLRLSSSGLTRGYKTGTCVPASKQVHAYPQAAPAAVGAEAKTPVNEGDRLPRGAHHFAPAMHRTQEVAGSSPVLAPPQKAAT